MPAAVASASTLVAASAALAKQASFALVLLEVATQK